MKIAVVWYPRKKRIEIPSAALDFLRDEIMEEWVRKGWLSADAVSDIDWESSKISDDGQRILIFKTDLVGSGLDVLLQESGVVQDNLFKHYRIRAKRHMWDGPAVHHLNTLLRYADQWKEFGLRLNRNALYAQKDLKATRNMPGAGARRIRNARRRLERVAQEFVLFH